MADENIQPISAGIEQTDVNMPTILTELNDKGLAFFFTYIEDETSTMEASITDNYVETNHAVQDHIAIKPRIYRLRGCIGEVVYHSTAQWAELIGNKINQNPILQKTLNAMKPIASVSGVLSSATSSAIAVVNQLENSYNRYKKMIEDNFIAARQRKLLNQKQETTVAYLNRILELRIPVTLKGLKFERTLDDDSEENKFERLYYLQSVASHQGNNNYITDIEVTIKEFRIATTKTTKPDPNKYGGFTRQDNSAIQKAEEHNQGSAKGETIKTPTKAEQGFSKVSNISAKPAQDPVNQIKKFFNEKLAQFRYRNYYRN